MILPKLLALLIVNLPRRKRKKSISLKNIRAIVNHPPLLTLLVIVRRRKRKTISQKKHKKSGMNAKSSDKVKDPQQWPHAYLQYEFVNKHVKFDELDFNFFSWRNFHFWCG